MARPVKVTLMGRSFTLQTDEDEAHVQRVALLVDGRLTDLQARARLPVESLALLAALTLGDDLEKERQKNTVLRREAQALAIKLRDRLSGLASET